MWAEVLNPSVEQAALPVRVGRTSKATRSTGQRFAPMCTSTRGQKFLTPLVERAALPVQIVG